MNRDVITDAAFERAWRAEAEVERLCPHCALPNFTTPPHVCDDREAWTRNQRDDWRGQALRRSPGLRFVRTYDNPQEAPVRRGRLRDMRPA